MWLLGVIQRSWSVSCTRVTGWASVLGIYIPPIVSIVGAVSRIRSWESNVLLRPSGLATWLNPSKASMSKFRIVAGRCGGLFTLYLPKTSLLSKFPSLLKLLHSNLTWSAFFFFLVSPFPLCTGLACEPTGKCLILFKSWVRTWNKWTSWRPFLG